mmetsp:Transcript_15483/g.54256  ORF Transcript_15483/g.54256 Transcript_15483/m.54256 type:complete len:272 (-) Transcript_15483:776-1591(-)
MWGDWPVVSTVPCEAAASSRLLSSTSKAVTRSASVAAVEASFLNGGRVCPWHSSVSPSTSSATSVSMVLALCVKACTARSAVGKQSESRIIVNSPFAITKHAATCSSSQGPAMKCVICAGKSSLECPTWRRASQKTDRRLESNGPRLFVKSNGRVKFTATMPSSPQSDAGSGRKRKVNGAISARTTSRRSSGVAVSRTSRSGPCKSNEKRRPRRWKLSPSSPKCCEKRARSSSSLTRSRTLSRSLSSTTLTIQKTPRTQLRYTSPSHMASG